MTSMREERLQQRVAEIRPQLAKAREIVEKAAAENREMTAEEQSAYDEIMAKGRGVADALKAHRHDQEVFAFAKELSDEIGIGGPGGELSSSGSPGKSRRLSFKGMGAHVAARMLPDGTKALAPEQPLPGPHHGRFPRGPANRADAGQVAITANRISGPRAPQSGST